MWQVLVNLVSAEQLGGWARATTAAVLGSASGWFGGALVPFMTPEFQAAFGIVVATVVVGVWSQVAKRMANK